MPDLTPFMGAIQTALGALIGGIVSVVSVRITMRQQYRLEVLRDREALRNTTRDRLRDAFTPVLLAAAMMDSIAQQTLSLWATKADVAALNDELQAIRGELSRAGVRILLEQHATGVEAAYNEVRRRFERFRAEYDILQQDLTDDRRQQLEEVRRQQDAVTSAVENLSQAMLAALAPLEEPIREITRGRPWWRPR